MVLATDMSLHFQQIKEMKKAVVTPDTLDRGSTMAFIVHAADISHPTKVWDLHKKWTDGLVEEFFRQVGVRLFYLVPIYTGCTVVRIVTLLHSASFSAFVNSFYNVYNKDLLPKVNTGFAFDLKSLANQ